MSVISIIGYVLSVIVCGLSIWLLICQHSEEAKTKSKAALLLGIAIAVITSFIEPTLNMFKPPPPVVGVDTVSLDKYRELSKKYDITIFVVNNFFKIMEEKDVPPEDFDDKLREFVERYRELKAKLSESEFDSTDITALKDKAKEAMENGDFDLAESLINQAAEKGLTCRINLEKHAAALQEEINKCRLSTAKSHAANGALASTRLEYRKAAEYYRKAVEEVPDSSELLKAEYLEKLGENSYYCAAYDDAEQALNRSLTIREKNLPEDHGDISEVLNDLAFLYKTQGRYSESEPLYKRSLGIAEKVHGRDHPSVAVTLNNLAALYDSQDRYSESEPLYKRSLEIKEEVHGREHPDVAVTLNNLAGLYRIKGRYSEAIPLYKRSLEITEKVHGRDHPSVAVTLNNLAELYRIQGRYSEAEPLYKRDLEITEKVHGREHPDVAVTLNNLAASYTSQRRYSEAEPLYKESLKIFKAFLPPGHQNIKIVQNNYEDLLSKLKGQSTSDPPVQKAAN